MDNQRDLTIPPVSLHGGHTVAADGSAHAEDMVQAAHKVGMEIYGLSEHFYRPQELRFRYDFETDDDDMGRGRWPSFVEEVRAVKQSSGQESCPRVLLGAELEYLPGYQEWTRKELEQWHVDYTVISVHFVEIKGNVVPFDFSPAHWHQAAEKCGGPVGLYRRYYEHLLDAITWDIGDVVGHFDVIKVFSPVTVEDPRVDELIDQALDLCAKQGKVLDLNARGLVKPCREVYPSLSILRRACKKGVGIITGDDSHSPEEVGLNLDRAAHIAKQAGYRKLQLPPRLGGQVWEL